MPRFSTVLPGAHLRRSTPNGAPAARWVLKRPDALSVEIDAAGRNELRGPYRVTVIAGETRYHVADEPSFGAALSLAEQPADVLNKRRERTSSAHEQFKRDFEIKRRVAQRPFNPAVNVPREPRAKR